MLNLFRAMKIADEAERRSVLVQFIQESPRGHEIERIEPFGETAIGCAQNFSGLSCPIQLLP